MNKNERIAIAGGGLVGSLWAVYMAQKGFQVDIYERRNDPRRADFVGGRSINLALSDRGWKALEGVGLGPKIKELAIPMHRRVMHGKDESITFQPYGNEGQAIYSVPRGGLNKILLEKADEYDNVNVFFNHRVRDIDLKTNVMTLENQETGERREEKYDRIFGTDGAFSAVRSKLSRRDRFNFSQTYLTHGYKELVIPPNADGSHRIEVEALHIWPRGEFMMIALPNQDGSFTCTLFFPFEGEKSFEALSTNEKIEQFFHEEFPDAIPHMPTLMQDYHENPSSSLVMISCSPWHLEDRICLMGDASHAIVPFYGQGMNSGFEDCTVLNDLFEAHHGDWGKTFEAFSKKRFPEAEAIRELALRNYIEMRDLTADPMFLLQKKIEKHFANKYPSKWIPLYSQVTFSHIPYDEALRNGERQDEIMKEVMNRPDIEDVWDSEEIENAILARI